MAFSSTTAFNAVTVTAVWKCLSWLALVALVPTQADTLASSWPWLCDAVIEHHARLRQAGDSRNVIGFQSIVGNFTSARIHDKLHNNSCADTYIPVHILNRCSLPTPYKLMDFKEGIIDFGKMRSKSWCFKGNWSMSEGERLKFGFKDPHQHWEGLIHTGNLEKEDM